MNSYQLLTPLHLAAFIGLIVGCGCSQETQTVRSPTRPEQRQLYAELIGLKRTQHPQLKAEYERLLAERTTPLWLDSIRQLPETVVQVPAVSVNSNEEKNIEPAALRLAKTFPAFTRNALSEQLASVYPVGGFDWGPAELGKARDIRRRYEAARRKFRDNLYAAERGIGLKISDGPLADLGCLDAIRIGCRLEGTLAADALSDGQPDEALVSISTMLRAAALLSQASHLACRLAAVCTRAEALQALGAAVVHAQATASTQHHAIEILTKETTNWPLDAQAWIGDRASGLITYELVRGGYFLSLLSQKETEELAKKEILLVTARTALRNVDDDEAFYLASVRRLIESCALPFHQRRETLQELQTQLSELQDSPQYPLVAGRLLLTDFEPSMRMQAEDLARCRAWCLALRLILQLPADTKQVNPLTGRPFQVELSADEVRVMQVLEAGDEPIIIPRRPAIRTARRANRERVPEFRDAR